MSLVIILYGLFASIFTITKYGLSYVQPFFLVGTRMLAAGVLLSAYALLVRKEKLPSGRQMWKLLFFLGLLNIYITNAFEFWGLQYLTSFKTCFIYSLSPFLSALISYFWFGEKMSGKKWLGFVIGCIGFLPILLSQSGDEGTVAQVGFLSLAELAVAGAAAATVVGWIIMRDLVMNRDCSPILANGISMLIGGVMALSHSYLVEDWNPLPVTGWGPFLYTAGLSIVISNMICYNLYGYLLRSLTATFVSFAGFMTPIFAAIYGSFLLGEEISWEFVGSVSIVLLGLLFFYQEELRESGIHLESTKQ